MPTPSSDPAALFQQLSASFGAEDLTIPVGQGNPYSVDAVHNVDTFAVAYQEGSGRLMNGVVLVHDLVLKPSFGPDNDGAAPRITDYWIAVQPLSNDVMPITPFGFDGHSPGSFFPDIAHPPTPFTPGPVRDAADVMILSSAPPTTEAGKTFSTGTSQTFSESAGFMGDTPTASASESTTVSWGQSQTVADVRIENLSNSKMSIVHYQVGADTLPPMVFDADQVPAPCEISQATFQPQLSQLFLFPDDGQAEFTRKGVAPTGPDAVYLFRIWIVARAVRYQQSGPMIGFPMLQPNYMWGGVSRTVWVQQPPLAGQSKKAA